MRTLLPFCLALLPLAATGAEGPATFKVNVQAEGTYLSGPPLGQKVPKPGFALIGGILESGEGNVFVKMTGPGAAAKAAGEEFIAMVEGALK